jgi:hypothetical protein
VFFRATMKAEIASARLEMTQRDLRVTNQRLRELAEQRKATAETLRVQFESCALSGGPVNLSERLILGGIGAVLTLLAVVLTHWWITRRA